MGREPLANRPGLSLWPQSHSPSTRGGGSAPRGWGWAGGRPAPPLRARNSGSLGLGCLERFWVDSYASRGCLCDEIFAGFMWKFDFFSLLVYWWSYVTSGMIGEWMWLCVFDSFVWKGWFLSNFSGVIFSLLCIVFIIMGIITKKMIFFIMPINIIIFHSRIVYIIL